MTDPQPSSLTPNYQPVPVAAGPKKPVSVIVLSIIGILIGAFSLLCAPLSIVGLVVDFGVPNPALDAMKSDPVLMAWNWFGVASMLIFGAWVLVASIGSLILKRWGRTSMVTYAIVQTTLAVVGVVMTFVVVQPRTRAVMGSQGAAMQPTWAIFLQIGLTVAMIAYFVCIAFFFTRPAVIDAFEAAEESRV